VSLKESFNISEDQLVSGSFHGETHQGVHARAAHDSEADQRFAQNRRWPAGGDKYRFSKEGNNPAGATDNVGLQIASANRSN